MGGKCAYRKVGRCIWTTPNPRPHTAYNVRPNPLPFRPPNGTVSRRSYSNANPQSAFTLDIYARKPLFAVLEQRSDRFGMYVVFVGSEIFEGRGLNHHRPRVARRKFSDVRYDYRARFHIPRIPLDRVGIMFGIGNGTGRGRIDGEGSEPTSRADIVIRPVGEDEFGCLSIAESGTSSLIRRQNTCRFDMQFGTDYKEIALILQKKRDKGDFLSVVSVLIGYAQGKRRVGNDDILIPHTPNVLWVAVIVRSVRNSAIEFGMVFEPFNEHRLGAVTGHINGFVAQILGIMP